MYVKANALQKLTFLSMLGYGMSWASFASIEVMSSPRFAHKRIAYLAASQGFEDDTEVILLATNLLKKVRHAKNHFRIFNYTFYSSYLTSLVTLCC